MKYRYFLFLAVFECVLSIGVGLYSYSLGKFDVFIVALLFIVLMGAVINFVLYRYFKKLSTHTATNITE
ncbi:hypothetical protein HMI01_06190 [Halolactibacillus miurensis]|uniref:Uncharacterized protein n=1 Tax=Halolactibacillus miurensis TaxID=306541 RepID=A0A1I6R347_9BACI|nr:MULTISPECIES: hypothetical protein [Halolactibacillus]GEM03631.1 hypothetical protein HMI01_06190 [Halolactibacillus miurensis]SFS58938.1 hypothetical protein SAMN05421668_10556 [Halolactibacillus miurensis]